MTPEPPIDPAAWVDVVRVDPDSDRPFQRLRARISHDHDVIDRERVGHATASAAEVLLELNSPDALWVQTLGGAGYGVHWRPASELARRGQRSRGGSTIDLSPRDRQTRARRR